MTKGGHPDRGDRPATVAEEQRGASPGASDASLDGDGGAGGLEGLLGLVRGLLGGVLEDRLGGGLDEVLRLLQTEGGEGAHLLDDVDLLVAGGLEDDLELVLLLGGGVATGSRGGGHGNGGSGGHAEGVLELLDELGELDQGHLLEGVKELVGAELRHDGKPFVCGAVAVCGCAGVSGGVRRPGQASVDSAAGSAASSVASVSAASSEEGASSAGASSAAGAAGVPAPPARIEGSCSAFAWSAPARRAAWAIGALSR